MNNKLQGIDKEQILDFVLVHGREPENKEELIAEQEKAFNEIFDG